MAQKRYNEEDILRLLREIKVHFHGGMDVASACRTAGISDKTYYGWRKRYGGIGRSKLTELKALEKENQRLKKILAELELDKLILKESLDYLKPRA
ncbi:transposase [bacterium]|nr:transposase [bacterium]MDC0537473.1 transposase [Planktomarina temperata]MDC1435287.1 transposase [bacterium]